MFTSEHLLVYINRNTNFIYSQPNPFENPTSTRFLYNYWYHHTFVPFSPMRTTKKEGKIIVHYNEYQGACPRIRFQRFYITKLRRKTGFFVRGRRSMIVNFHFSDRLQDSGDMEWFGKLWRFR